MIRLAPLIRLADLAPWPTPASSKAAEARFDLLSAAAASLDLFDAPTSPRREEWDNAMLPADRLPALRDAVEAEGRKGQRVQVGVAGPFTDGPGYQWRWSPRHKAPARRQVAAILDRLTTQETP
jgi:hypothetical protein